LSLSLSLQVREEDLPVAFHTLSGELSIYKEENGELVPLNLSDSSNGFLKAKSTCNLTVHPVQSPHNQYCVLTLDRDTLPSISTILMDVLFYSNGVPEESPAGSQNLESFRFFAFSLIDDYISIVMDTETQKKYV
ncbi:hypothetical protein FKM82_029265, partial [Ascaphus truei]